MKKLFVMFVAFGFLMAGAGGVWACVPPTIDVYLTVESWVELDLNGDLRATVSSSNGNWFLTSWATGQVDANAPYKLTAFPVFDDAGTWQEATESSGYKFIDTHGREYAVALNKPPADPEGMLYLISLCNPGPPFCQSGFKVDVTPGLQDTISIGLIFGEIDAPLNTKGEFASPGVYYGHVMVVATLL